MTISLRQYAREAQHGSQEAMVYILKQFEPLVKKQARKYQHNYQSFEEAKSSIHHAAIHCIMNFDLTQPQTVQAILPGQIYNFLSREAYQRKKYQKYVQKDFADDNGSTDLPKECIAPLSSCPENHYLKNLRVQKLRNALNTLNEKERAFIRLHYLYGYTNVKIASIYQIDESYVRKVSRRALKVLKNQLQEEKSLMFD